MKMATYLFVLLGMLLASAPARGATIASIPSFQVGGSHSQNDSSAFSIMAVGVPDGNGGYTLEYTVTFTAATLSVTQLFDAGNSGLAVNDNLAFAGGSITAPLFNGNYVPFAASNLVTFTTLQGNFAYDSTNLGLFMVSDVAAYIPGFPISDAPLIAFSTGTLHGPGGDSPADLMFFVNGFSSQVPFGDVAWALYAPTVLPTLPFSTVPEPSTWTIFGIGALALVYRRRRRV
ncbi:MAG: PEP-CTERM sorting domain-containing protein [Planctomycetota bacterium]